MAIPIGIAVTILSLAIPVVSTYTGIRTRDELCIAYLWDVTRFARFADCAGAAVVANLTCWLTGALAATGSRVVLLLHAATGIVGLGLTVGTVWALAGIMLEVILIASRPDFAVAAGARHHALKLAEGLYRLCYHRLFMGTHQRLLDTAFEGMPAVEGPGRISILRWGNPVGAPTTSPWQIGKKIAFETHYLDYDLDRLRGLVETLPEGTTICLEQYGPQMNKPGNRLELGKIVPRNPDLAEELSRHAAVVRARRDKCLEWRPEDINAWQDLLQRSIHGILSEYDQTSFTALVSTVMETWFRCRNVVPKEGEMRQYGRKLCYPYIQILDQILGSQPGIGVTWAMQVCDFVGLLQDQFREAVDKCVQQAETDLLDVYLEQIPGLYDGLCRWCELHEGEPGVADVRHIRAIWGTDLWLFHSTFVRLPEALPSKQKGEILYAGHCRYREWLKTAVRRKDGYCAASIAKALGRVFDTAKRWHDELAGVPRGGMSFYDVILVRHLALMGEAIQEAQQSAPGWEQALKELLKVEVPLSPQEGLDVLTRLRATMAEGILDDFKNIWENMEIESTDPPLGLSHYVGAYPSPERANLFLGLTFYLVRALGALPPDEALPVCPQAIDVKKVAASLSDLESAKHALAKHQVVLPYDDAEGKRLLDWFRSCQQAYEDEKAIKLAKAEPNPKLLAEYKERFPKEYAAGLRLLRYMLRNGFFSVSGEAEVTRMDYVQKICFLTPEEDGYHGSDACETAALHSAHWSDKRLVLDLLKALDQEESKPAAIGKPAGEAVAEAARASVQDAARWLTRTSVDPVAGLILWNGAGMLDRVLEGDEAWVPSRRESMGVGGFAGRYAGYPVWQCTRYPRPLVAAIDLASSKPLSVRTSVSERDEWCEVVEISAQLDQALEERIKKDLLASGQDAMVGQYCRRRLRFFWRADVSELRQHARLFALEPGGEEPAEL